MNKYLAVMIAITIQLAKHVYKTISLNTTMELKLDLTNKKEEPMKEKKGEEMVSVCSGIEAAATRKTSVGSCTRSPRIVSFNRAAGVWILASFSMRRRIFYTSVPAKGDQHKS